MNKFETSSRIGLALSTQLAFLLAVSLLLWSMGAPMLLKHAQAANLTVVSDTLTTSNPGVLAGHVIAYNNATSTIAGQTIKIGFDESISGGSAAFAEAFSSATSTDYAFYDGATKITVSNGPVCTAGTVLPTGNFNNGTDENVTFTVCPSTTLASGNIVIGIGTSTGSTKLITNPVGTGSYPVTISGTQDNNGETRIAVLPAVTLTAAVATTLTFTVTGLATSTGFNGNATTTGSTTATTLPFGTIAVGTTSILGQQLSVATNARNGFAVTVQENQPPTSSTGATIDLFSNGATTSNPIAWVSPTHILNVPSTYGHFGITSDDVLENSNEFASSTHWAGNIDQPRVIFNDTGPADGVTQNYGIAKVGYRIEISALQEAGNDYTNTLTYVATPTF